MAVFAAVLPVRPSNSISAAKGVHPPPTTHHSRRFFLQILDQTLHPFAQLREDFRDGTKPDLLKPFEKSRPGAAAFEAVIRQNGPGDHEKPKKAVPCFFLLMLGLPSLHITEGRQSLIRAYILFV